MKETGVSTTIGAVVLSLLTLPLLAIGENAQAGNGKATIQLCADTCWVVWPDEPEALQRALRDVEQDWYKVFGRLPTVLKEPPAQKNWNGPLIYLGLNAPWLKNLNKQKFAGKESFILEVRSDTAQGAIVLATGADMRGAIYAAYALSEEFLGVDPWYYWVDKQPKYVGQVEAPANYRKVSGPPTFKYRGFFINDEDLLARFSPDPMEENVFSPAMWDRIFETLLRLRGNTIIPGTFTFPDEKCQILASRRGLINSQHHIMSVGLNTYQWPDGVPFSYYHYPEILEKYWKECIDAMKDREIVWTVNYRGKHDRPFWEDEPEIKTSEDRGKIISAAIGRQVELVRKVQPEADFICNLWNEGGELYKQGHLKLDKGIIMVWADNGTGTMRDGGRVQAGDGIYYHTAAFNFRGANQLTEVVNPGRIHREMGRFVRAGATSYFVVNISDVRPVPLTTDYAMKMAWDASSEIKKTSEQAMDDHLLNWSQQQFGAEHAKAIAKIYKQYFATSYMHENRCGDTCCGDTKIFQNLSKRINSLTEEFNETGGPTREMIDPARSDVKIYGELHRRFLDLAERAERIKGEIPPERRNFYQGHLLTQIAVYRHGFAITEHIAEAVVALGDKDRDKGIERLDAALKEYDEFFASLRKAEYSPWESWYAGDRFVYIHQTRHGIRQCRAIIAGETPPPPTLPRARYPVLYRYQEKGRENFPLLYRKATD